MLDHSTDGEIMIYIRKDPCHSYRSDLLALAEILRVKYTNRPRAIKECRGDAAEHQFTLIVVLWILKYLMSSEYCNSESI
jgi:hypothetical protein